MKQSAARRTLIAAVGWIIALGLFFPIFWMVLTSFKTEVQAVASPPLLVFHPTLGSYAEVNQRSNYLIARSTGLLDTRTAMVIVYTLMNMPIVVWMLFTFFKEVPKEILEAGRMDGATRLGEVWHVLLPLSLPGVASTGLLSLILCWNEAFWSLNLTSSAAAPLTAFIASFSSPEGLFFGKLSAASTLAVAPILVFGWLSQKQLVRGLTFGAVK